MPSIIYYTMSIINENEINKRTCNLELDKLNIKLRLHYFGKWQYLISNLR